MLNVSAQFRRKSNWPREINVYLNTSSWVGNIWVSIQQRPRTRQAWVKIGRSDRAVQNVNTISRDARVQTQTLQPWQRAQMGERMSGASFDLLGFLNSLWIVNILCYLQVNWHSWGVWDYQGSCASLDLTTALNYECNLRSQYFFEVIMFFDVWCLLFPSISILSKRHPNMLIRFTTLQLWGKKSRMKTKLVYSENARLSVTCNQMKLNLWSGEFVLNQTNNSLFGTVTFNELSVINS